LKAQSAEKNDARLQKQKTETNFGLGFAAAFDVFAYAAFERFARNARTALGDFFFAAT
jgi:hypothetical protein